MPKLQDIEQFKVSLKSLGKEPETLDRWGESWSDTQPPPSGVSDDIAELLGSDGTAAAPAAGPGMPSADADFTSFLDGLQLDEPTESPAAEVQPQGTAATEDFDDFSVPSSLLEGLDLGSAEEPAEAEESDDLEELPADEAVEPEEPLPEAEAGAEETFGLDDLDALAARTPESAGAEPFDEFSIPESMSADDEAPSEPEASPESQEPEAPLEPTGPPEAAVPEEGNLGAESTQGDAFDQFDLGGNSRPGCRHIRRRERIRRP